MCQRYYIDMKLTGKESMSKHINHKEFFTLVTMTTTNPFSSIWYTDSGWSSFNIFPKTIEKTTKIIDILIDATNTNLESATLVFYSVRQATLM